MAGRCRCADSTDAICRRDIVRPGFLTPFGAPHVPAFPFSNRNAEILTLAYCTRRSAMEVLLPEPLVATSEVVLIHIYKLHDT